MGSEESNDLKFCDWHAIITDSLWKKRINLYEFEALIRHKAIDKSLCVGDIGFW